MSGLLRVLGTGSREFTDRQLLGAVLMSCWHDALQLGADGIVLVEGEASGADRLMREWAEANGVAVEAVPADWDGPCGDVCQPGHRRRRPDGSDYCPTAGHRRNQVMVDRGAVVAVGFLVAGLPCRGTWDCLRRASRAGIPLFTVEEQR